MLENAVLLGSSFQAAISDPSAPNQLAKAQEEANLHVEGEGDSAASLTVHTEFGTHVSPC